MLNSCFAFHGIRLPCFAGIIQHIQACTKPRELDIIIESVRICHKPPFETVDIAFFEVSIVHSENELAEANPVGVFIGVLIR